MRKNMNRLRNRFPLWWAGLLMLIILLVVFVFFYQLEARYQRAQTSIKTQQLVEGINMYALSRWYGDEDMTALDVQEFMGDVMYYVPESPAGFAAEFYGRDGESIFRSAEKTAFIRCVNGQNEAVGNVSFYLDDFMSEEAMGDIIRMSTANTLGELSYAAGFKETDGSFIPVKIVFESFFEEGLETYVWKDQDTWTALEKKYQGKTIEADGCGELYLVAHGSSLNTILLKNTSYTVGGLEFQLLDSSDAENQSAWDCLEQVYSSQSTEIHKSWASKDSFQLRFYSCSSDRAAVEVNGGGVYGIIVLSYQIPKMVLSSPLLWSRVLFLAAVMWWMFVGMNRLKKRQDRLTRNRNTFINAMAHEMKTPAAVIKNSTECILEEVCPEKNAHYLNMIARESDRMNELLTKMLMYSRTADKGEMLRKEPVDLAQVTRDICELYDDSAKQRGLTLDIADTSSKPVMADPDLIRTVIDNYVSNGIRYGREGSFVKIAICQNRFQIENECEPLTAEELRLIWEPMYVRDKARSRTDGSAGMGLAICKNILELHHGKFGAENTEKGIRFFFEL